MKNSDVKKLVGNGALAMIKNFLINNIKANETELEILKNKFLKNL